jgi:meiotically up-regulated gene 157 (Mug157) protein
MIIRNVNKTESFETNNETIIKDIKKYCDNCEDCYACYDDCNECKIDCIVEEHNKELETGDVSCDWLYDAMTNKLVANVKLTNGNGQVNRCNIFMDKFTRIDLRKYLENPMKIKALSDKLHLQNVHTAIVVNSNDIEDIEIHILEGEW